MWVLLGSTEDCQVQMSPAGGHLGGLTDDFKRAVHLMGCRLGADRGSFFHVVWDSVFWASESSALVGRSSSQVCLSLTRCILDLPFLCQVPRGILQEMLGEWPPGGEGNEGDPSCSHVQGTPWATALGGLASSPRAPKAQRSPFRLITKTPSQCSASQTP